MREVHIYRADGDDVPRVLIRVDHHAPSLPYGAPGYAQQAAARFASEGAALAAAIWASCPGGTIDALIAALMARRASLLRVKFPEADDATT